MEDFAYIIDYLPAGLPGRRKEPVAYGIGDREFRLLELLPKLDATLSLGDRVYIGKDMEKRAKIAHVRRRIRYHSLTSAAQSELLGMLIKIVRKDENRFIRFYNETSYISRRKHALELLPTLGKKTLVGVLEERKKGGFKNFDDLVARTPLKNPVVVIAKRITQELSEDTKYRLFIR